MLYIHKYRVCNIHKSGPDLYIVEWLSQKNHTENRDQEITGMTLNLKLTLCINLPTISTFVNKPIGTSIEHIQAAT